MKPRIISWNVRGLNKRDKRLRVSNLLRDWKADIVSSRSQTQGYVSQHCAEFMGAKPC